MNLLSINDAISRASLLGDSCVYIEGTLAFEFEDISISHWPKAERMPDYASSIWIIPDAPIFRFEDQVLERWSGKRVVVYGSLEFAKKSQADGWDEGFGHFALWPAQIRARRIDLFKRLAKEHPEIKHTEQDAAHNHSPAESLE